MAKKKAAGSKKTVKTSPKKRLLEKKVISTKDLNVATGGRCCEPPAKAY